MNTVKAKKQKLIEEWNLTRRVMPVFSLKF